MRGLREDEKSQDIQRITTPNAEVNRRESMSIKIKSKTKGILTTPCGWENLELNFEVTKEGLVIDENLIDWKWLDEARNIPCFEYNGGLYIRLCSRGVVLADHPDELGLEEILDEGNYHVEIKAWKDPS